MRIKRIRRLSDWLDNICAWACILSRRVTKSYAQMNIFSPQNNLIHTIVSIAEPRKRGTKNEANIFCSFRRGSMPNTTHNRKLKPTVFSHALYCHCCFPFHFECKRVPRVHCLFLSFLPLISFILLWSVIYAYAYAIYLLILMMKKWPFLMDWFSILHCCLNAFF